ncbi:MAG: LacI family DNA-binding transcriptional regulator [Armatimonadetes bacterium]|nr:LacI family DNA-binding transcriptional regulator [Armatimonadota bacterium]MBS1726196.1 LacI family DNA-binding transcriptional regulator [Armatimonadota bacterium]
MANISGATVSRVLSGRTDVAIAPETRERVLKAAQELGYLPNSAARALISGRTGLVGFWMSLEYSPYRGEVLELMRILLRGTECALAVTDVDEEYNWAHSFDRALRVPVDGIIAFDNSASVEAFATQADSLAPLMPFVSMGAYWSEARSFVGVDLYKGAEKAMHHLIETGRKSVAYVAPWTSDLINSGPRFDAYCACMTEAGLEPQTIGVQTTTFGAIKQVLDETLDQKQLPEALLCMNDEMALAASIALEKRGLQVGKDVAIVGFNGIRETATAPVPITTVRQPIEEMCSLAWKFLDAQMKDPKAPLQQKILIPELVVRESSAP